MWDEDFFSGIVSGYFIGAALIGAFIAAFAYYAIPLIWNLAKPAIHHLTA